jgi:hypothetical protein
MISQRQLALLVLTLSLGVFPVLAQQAPAEDADSAAQEQDTESGAKPQEQRSTAAGEPGPASKPAPASKESPFDYRSSEEISEDLSVSFPVDI